MGRPKLDRPRYKLRINDHGYWTIYWTENRIPRSHSTGTADESEAQAYKDQWEADRDAPRLAANPTVNHILDHYLADRHGHVSSYDTLVNSCKPLRRHLGNLLPEQLSRRLYWDRRKRDRIGKKRKPVSNGTIIREGVTLRAAFETAAADKLLPKSAIPTITLPPAPGPRERWLTREEFAKLKAAARSPHIQLFIALGVATGGRKEALETLTWDQVDLDEGLVSLSLPGRVASKKRRATVPINGDLRAELVKAKEAATGKHVLEWHGKPLGNIKKGFQAAVKRSGIDYCTPHVLRHTAATWMVMSGIPCAQVARYLGDSEKTIERVYGKHAPDYLRKASESLQVGSSQTP